MNNNQSDALLSAIAQSALKLLAAPDWRAEIHELLKLLGEATGASHAYLFENHLGENQMLLTSQKYEWVGPEQNAEIDNPDFQNVPVLEEGLVEWHRELSNGRPFYNTTKIFQTDWANLASRENIKTLLDVPIFVSGKWWGIIGFDDCIREMPWSQAEVDALQAAAGMLGAAIKRQQADEALRISENKFHTTFHHTLIPMVIGRLSDRKILDANQAFCDQFGYSPEETMGRTADDLRLWASQEEHARHSALLSKQGSIREFKARFRHKSGEIGVTLISTAPIIVNGEECALYSLFDITKLEKLLVELQSKNNELERFTYTASHDLKAPLITIGGFLGYLEKDIDSGNIPSAKKDIQRVMDAVYKMRRLLNELLEISRIGRLVNQKEDAKLGDIVDDAIRLLHGRLISSNVKVKVEKDLPTVHVDRARIVQVIQNLVDNSAKFMGNQTNPSIEVGSVFQNGERVYFVRDNGIGIDMEFIERVFELFEKLSAESEGTGIGLALAKRIIEFHGGRIWASSEGKNKGTIFFFTLPEALQKGE